MTSTIPKNQIIYRYGLDIFHNLSDFKTLVSDVKNIAENVGMDWKICFGLCPTSDFTTVPNTEYSTESSWLWANFLQDGWKYSKETENLNFLNLPVNIEYSNFYSGQNQGQATIEAHPFYCKNITSIHQCDNNSDLIKWFSFKQDLLNNLEPYSTYVSNKTGNSYPYFGRVNQGTEQNPNYKYFFYTQRCSIIFFLENENNVNSTYIIDCFCNYQYSTYSSVGYPCSIYIVGNYGVKSNIDVSLTQWLASSNTNDFAYSSGSAGARHAAQTIQTKESEQFSSCYLKYIYFCGKETSALSSPFFTKENISITPQNRSSSYDIKNNTASIFFSKLYQANNQDGFCVLDGNKGENDGNSSSNYIHCYTNHPWCIPYHVNGTGQGWNTIAIPSGEARKNYSYNGVSQFKDVTGRDTPHLYKKFWGGRELYDCFALEDVNGNIKRMFGGSFFCIDFADEGGNSE